MKLGNGCAIYDSACAEMEHSATATGVDWLALNLCPRLRSIMASAPLPVEILPPSAPGVVSIRLRSLDLLFRGPDIDPFVGSYDGRSGIDELQLALKSRWSRNLPEIAVVEWVVPVGEATEQCQELTRNAIAGWYRAQADRIKHDLSVMAKERRRAWLVGGLFFVACFVIAATLEATEALSGLGGTLVSETIVIAGWVGLWHPLELTLYAWWPLRFRLKLLERGSCLAVKLVPEPRDRQSP